MAFPATVYRVMIASPGDVAAERAIVRSVFAEWNAAHAERRGLVILPLGWEVDVAPEMGDTPQDIIDKRILHEADLLIGIFWTRLGTPTAHYASGAVEEIEEHVSAGKPAMLYFSSAPTPLDAVDAAHVQSDHVRPVGLLAPRKDVDAAIDAELVVDRVLVEKIFLQVFLAGAELKTLRVEEGEMQPLLGADRTVAGRHH